MASKFKTGHTIPPEFPDILKDFVREVLREQPANIFSFGAVYFQNKSDETGGGGEGIGGMSEEALVEYLTNLFVQADVDKNGVLDRAVPLPPIRPIPPTRLAPLPPPPTPPSTLRSRPAAARRVASAFPSPLSSHRATLPCVASSRGHELKKTDAGSGNVSSP